MVYFDSLPRLLSVILSSLTAIGAPSCWIQREVELILQLNDLYSQPRGATDPPLNLRPLLETRLPRRRSVRRRGYSFAIRRATETREAFRFSSLLPAKATALSRFWSLSQHRRRELALEQKPFNISRRAGTKQESTVSRKLSRMQEIAARLANVSRTKDSLVTRFEFPHTPGRSCRFDYLDTQRENKVVVESVE